MSSWNLWEDGFGLLKDWFNYFLTYFLNNFCLFVLLDCDLNVSFSLPNDCSFGDSFLIFFCDEWLDLFNFWLLIGWCNGFQYLSGEGLFNVLRSAGSECFNTCYFINTLFRDILFLWFWLFSGFLVHWLNTHDLWFCLFMRLIRFDGDCLSGCWFNGNCVLIDIFGLLHFNFFDLHFSVFELRFCIFVLFDDCFELRFLVLSFRNCSWWSLDWFNEGRGSDFFNINNSNFLGCRVVNHSDLLFRLLWIITFNDHLISVDYISICSFEGFNLLSFEEW